MTRPWSETTPSRSAPACGGSATTIGSTPGSPSRSASASLSMSDSARARSSPWPSALGLREVCGIDADVWDIAAAMGRGRRSGVGTAAFHDGRLRRRRRPQEGADRPRGGADRRVAPRFSRRLALPRGDPRRGPRPQRTQRRGGLRSPGAVGADLGRDLQDHAAQADAGARRARHRRVRPRLDCRGPQDRRVLLGGAGRRLRRRRDQRRHRCAAERRRLRGGTELLGAGGLRPRAREATWGGPKWRFGSPWRRRASARRSS